MPSTRIAPYGFWRSPITSDLIVAQSIGLSEVRLDGDAIWWLEGRPQEGGRSVLMRRAPDGAVAEISPPDFNIRTRVHEYGGGAWTVADGTVFFSNDRPGPAGARPDRRLYRQAPGAAPVAVTAATGEAGEEWRFADGLVDPRRRLWIGVGERHQPGRAHPDNMIVAVPLEGEGAGSIRILAQGHDFFASPRLSPDGGRLAWLAWDHPNMPWVETTLFVADLDAAGAPAGTPRAVAGGSGESVFQPEWSPDGQWLVFAADRSGWWNLYRCDGNGGPVEPVLAMAAEFGQPQWVFGLSAYAFSGPGRLLCSYIEGGLGKLALVDLLTGALTPVDIPFTDISSVRADERIAVFRAGSPRDPAQIVRLDLATGRWEVLKRATGIGQDPALRGFFAPAQPVEFPTAGGRTAHGLYYPPTSADHAAPDGDVPPLVVKIHGGPTSAASSTLNLGIQYWTSRGIAVLDVNYGGSTGYGRAYRDRLNLTWGVVDVQDAVAGAKYLASQGLADAARSVITGGSAGGYTALAALAFDSYFAGGASHFGVSDAAALARDTHKFESRYLDWLIGPYPAEAERYRERSPLFHADKLSKPVIFFQGDEDEVVPPNQTEAMVDALRAKGQPVGYVLFAGEQHGFRKAANIQRALDGELAFYAVEIFKTGLAF
ncbi:S9 family peptidase [Inquilinus limosus]|uniref:Peptidase n=1 Tax=Inquilinus limosus TaxID=171674 RepID=A0A211ZQA7_9PROT|nr:S9 family peptidase [Inquilinus limosus]OWJ67364.1 peptidase [Inquilinus limosus]